MMSLFKSLFGKKQNCCCNVVIQEVNEAETKETDINENCCGGKKESSQENEQENKGGSCCK
ncbi:hypothetical protein ACQCN2_15685 [Brevibacillus ginsengisoli]|uniref:hypothetical protein n=1 Tax=Brevibacillus ginsengisoli TaxID=363854 RepID=UPI003CF6E151